jgi:hypothetical protein
MLGRWGRCTQVSLEQDYEGVTGSAKRVGRGRKGRKGKEVEGVWGRGQWDAILWSEMDWGVTHSRRVFRVGGGAGVSGVGWVGV